MKFAVIVFPGSNCDVDMYHAIKDELGEEVEYVWHTETDLSQFDGILLPGGFSYGDYLRCGAIARFSNVMENVVKAADEGKPVLGVCNGFQVKNFCTKHADKIDKDYDSKKYKCLTKCLEIKFLQCFEFRKAVLDSVSKNLVEYAPWDSEFGAKWDSWEAAYTGINACGRCMMMVRENAINGMYSI